MANQTLNFRANTRLKDILGRGLILNDNVAIIELIKNASDANSERVNVLFSNANKKFNNSQLIVQDFGDGMSLEDFRTKWLNIAFSGKRNKTNKGRAFAGEKGVGRFSCDRLGRRLRLISKKKNAPAFEAIINWEDFEVDDIDKEISGIDIIARTDISDADYLPYLEGKKTGTRLIIEGLRSVWDFDKLTRLKKELERFIIDPDKKFKVLLKSNDIKSKSGDLVFNEYVENRLFEKLDEKTTSIHSETSDDGNEILTELRHDGKVILSYRQPNLYSELQNLKVKVQIHYLNTGAKISFKNITGYTSAEYGSVMMFLNGFRVMPYGDPDNDWLGLNRRKTQGTSRYLGGREVFGRVEVYDDNRTIIPVTSREGVENNSAFLELSSYDLGDAKAKRGFIHAAFLALETYVVRGLDWDRVSPRDGNYSYEETLNAMLAAVNQIENRADLDGIQINETQIQKIAREKISDYEDFVEKLKSKVANKQIYDLTPAEKRNVKKFVGRVDSRIEAANKTAKELKKTVKAEKARRLFLEARSKPDSKKVEELIHHIGHLSRKIEAELKEAASVLESKPIAERLQDQGVINRLHSAIFNNKKLLKLSEIVAVSDFNLLTDQITEDVFAFIEQYIERLRQSKSSLGVKIEYNNSSNLKLPLSFSPLEVTMMVDNILDNAARASAKRLIVNVATTDNYWDLNFMNNGSPLTEEYKPEDLFNPGVTVTGGSGIGLSQVRRVANKLDAVANIYQTPKDKVVIRLRWNNEA